MARVEAAVRASAAQPFAAALPVSPTCSALVWREPPRVAMDAAGDVAAIWTRRTSAGGDYHVESAVKVAGAAVFEPSESRSSISGNSPCNSDIQMTRDGRVTATWDFAESGAPALSYYADRGAPFATGAWSPPAKLAALPSIKPLLALDDAGDAAATWISGGQILSAVRTGLGGFSPPNPLSGVTELGGQAVAGAWQRRRGGGVRRTSNGNDAISLRGAGPAPRSGT